ncbi:maleylpyruvate isomerase family mycothiol-dependent enzyme [Actinomadura sp. ATCC 31491]|uniref:Maleylpyruvate isomerase family mycothiol-dependent enzyme n=1 Tax=Actinomadura luzonensis TaxID=2805427 RepID=A0ABT0G7E0_9ACTN|nr:maleylpyruvate isomerase family mycothiol-dependent enzyme [Actinomadura luzonensis]MCK2220508.1 maleylpyruvate isomerase family mycothiol-dependent enzyme [Actinomadura luzonensis]
MTDAYLFDGQTADDHVAGCPHCSAAIALLRRPEPALAPPPTLREAVLSKARRRRTPAALGVATVTVPYAEQVALMDDLLGDLRGEQWDAPVPKHGTVAGLMAHLTANDAAIARFVGAPACAGTGPHRRWREQAGALLERVSAGSEVLLGVEVALAGVRPARAPLRQALVQRTFETWTHADDIRAATGRARAAPRAAHVHLIAEFGLALLPRALKGPRRDVSATVVLTGPGGGTWTIPLSRASDHVAVLVSADAVDFCRLVAGRWPPEAFPYAAEGDAALARELLHAASTLGCD